MRSFIVNLNIIGLLAVCLFACNRHSSNLLLHQVDSLLDVKPDSALIVLRSIPALDEMPEVDRAYYALLMAEATDKNELPLLPCDSLLEFALDYYGDDDKEMAIALLYKGRLLAQMNDNKAAIEKSLEALDILRNYPGDTKYRGLIYSALGVWYGDCGLYDKALEVLKELLSYSSTAKDSSISYNGMSFIYCMQEKQDSATIYQRRAVDYAYSSGDSGLIITSLHNMSLRYDELENTDSAISYARKVMAMISSKNKREKSLYYYNIGDLYLGLEEYDSAKYYLDSALSLPDAPISVYQSLSDLEKQLGDYQKAHHFLEEYTWRLDSVLDAESVTQVQHLVYKYQTEMSVKDEQMQSRRMIGIIVSVFVVSAFVLILIYQNRINQKKKEHSLLRQSLQYADKKMQTMREQIEENESVITLLHSQQGKDVAEIERRERVIAQLKEEIANSHTFLFKQTPIYKKVEALSSQEEIKEKKKRRSFSARETEILKETVFEIYSDYISSLQETYPRLSENDVFFLCLQHIGLPSLRIALCLGFSDTLTINQRKSRMKAKMS